MSDKERLKCLLNDFRHTLILGILQMLPCKDRVREARGVLTTCEQTVLQILNSSVVQSWVFMVYLYLLPLVIPILILAMRHKRWLWFIIRKHYNLSIYHKDWTKFVAHLSMTVKPFKFWRRKPVHTELCMKQNWEEGKLHYTCKNLCCHPAKKWFNWQTFKIVHQSVVKVIRYKFFLIAANWYKL